MEQPIADKYIQKTHSIDFQRWQHGGILDLPDPFLQIGQNLRGEAGAVIQNVQLVVVSVEESPDLNPVGRPLAAAAIHS